MNIDGFKKKDGGDYMKKLLTALVVGAMLLSGCSSNSGDGSSKYDTSVYKDYYIAGNDYETLNYLSTSKAVDLRTITQFVDGLTENNQYGQIVGALAKNWEVNEDFTVWTFHLREGVKWVDWEGNEVGEVKADDFVYAAEYILNPKNSSNQTVMYGAVKGANDYYDTLDEGGTANFSSVGVKALDDYTVEYTMEAPTPYFISITLYAAYCPVSREFVASIAPSGELTSEQLFGTDNKHILYCGPWLFTVDEKDSRREYTKNPTYWDLENIHFDKVETIAIADQDTAWNYFQQGDISYASVSLTQYEAHKDENYIVQLMPGEYAYQIFLNSDTSYSTDTNAAVKNEAFRLSIRYGWDYEAYAAFQNAMDPASIIASGYVIPGLVTAPDGTDYADLGPLKDYTNAGFLDVDKAQEYKEKAMSELSGVTFPIVINYYVKTGNETAMQTAETVKDFLETNLGTDYIEIAIKEYASSHTQEVLKTKLNGLSVSGWGADYADPINILETMKSDGYMNSEYSHFTAEDLGEYDALIEKANAETTDIQKRYELFAEAEAYLLDHAFITPVMQASSANYLRVTTVNEFERPYSQCGTTKTKIKGFTLNNAPVTTADYNKALEEWKTKREKLMTTEGEFVMED